MELIIRRYNDDDYEEVYNIIYDIFGRKKIKKKYDNNYLEFVAERDNEIVGYFLLTRIYDVVLESKYFLVDYVCVKNNCKRCGVGYKMMEYAYDFVKNDGGSYLELHSSAHRVEAHSLYRKCGYEKLDKYLFRREIR